MFTIDTILMKIQSITGITRISDKAYIALIKVGSVLSLDPEFRYNGRTLIKITGTNDTIFLIQQRNYGEFYLDEFYDNEFF